MKLFKGWIKIMTIPEQFFQITVVAGQLSVQSPSVAPGIQHDGLDQILWNYMYHAHTYSSAREKCQ